MPTNTGHIDYLPVSKRCGSKSQPVGETQFNLPSPSLKKTASNFQQWPHRTSTQNQRPHDSNISLRHSHASHQPLNSNSTISHFQQQSYGSVNGAVVYGNPYTTEQEMLNHSSSPSSCTSSALYSNASPNHRPSSYSKQPSPYDDFSPPVNTPAKKVGSLCGSRGSMSPLLRSKPSLKSTPLSPSLIPRSSSAPSTPPLGEHSPTNLPPYRTPPLYQSVSVGNLNRTNRDVAALNPRVGYSLSKKRRDGKLQVQPMEREYVKVPVSSPICEFGPESHHAFAHLGPTRVSCNLSAGFESMATRDEGKSRTSSQNTSGVLKMNSSPSPQRTVTTPLRCASSDQNGIFTARPAIADGSDKHDPNENGSREFGAGYNGLSHATQCNTDLCGTVLTNPYAKPRHPPNLTQDKPSLDGVNVPLVVPTPHRPMTSTNHVFNSGGSKGEHDDKLYDAVKSVVSDDQIVSQHSTKKPFWMFGQHHNPQVVGRADSALHHHNAMYMCSPYIVDDLPVS